MSFGNMIVCKEPLVSIIMPTYNRGYIIGNAIESVLKQTYQNWELIVVDDGSNDDTEDVLGQYLDGRIIYKKNESNRGANFCRNQGVSLASGEYLAFLDSDNVWDKEKLKMQMAILQNSDARVAFTYCSIIIEQDNQKQQIIPENDDAPKNLKQTLLRGNIIDTNTALIKRKCFEEAGGFDINIPRFQDWEFFFRLIYIYQYQALFLKQCLVRSVLQSNSISCSREKFVQARLYFLKKYSFIYNEPNLILDFLNPVIYGEKTKDYQSIFKILVETYSGETEILADILQIIYERELKYEKHTNWLNKLLDRYSSDIKNETWNTKLNEGSTIAIYGAGKYGELLYKAIINTNLQIKYAIDKNKKVFHGLPVYCPHDKLEEVDYIVIAVINDTELIKKQLEVHYEGTILTLDEFVDLL